MNSRFPISALILVAAVGGACAPATSEDDTETTESAIGPGQPAIRRSFVFVRYGVPGLERVLVHRSEHDSTAGRGNWVRYDVSAFKATASSATCFTTQVGRNGGASQTASVLSAASDGAGGFVLASREGPTHSTYTQNDVVSVDFECFVGQRAYFHVGCTESNADGSFAITCAAR